MVDETSARVPEDKKGQTIQEVLSKYKALLDCDRVHFAPAIPEKKLRNAIAAYASNVAPESVLVLVDDTTFHGAREGMLITETHIYSHAAGHDPICRGLSQISPLGYKKKWTSVRISARGEPLGELVLLDKHFLTLIEMLQEMSQAAPGASGMTQEKATESSSPHPNKSKEKTTPPKKKYTKEWFIPVGKLNVYMLGPLLLGVAGIAVYLGIPFSGWMTLMCLLLLLGAAFAFGLGSAAMKGKPLDGEEVFMLLLAPCYFILCGWFVVLSVAIPWFGRDALLQRTASADANVRREVAEDLRDVFEYSNLKDARLIPALTTLAADPDADVRKAAIESLGWAGDPDTVETLMNATGDAVTDVRLEAARALGRIKNQRARPVLSEMVRSDPSPEVRKKARWAMGRLPGATERSDPSPSGKPAEVAQSGSSRPKTGAEIGYALGMIFGTIFGIVCCWKIHPILGIITFIVAIIKVLPQILAMLGS